MIQQQEATLVQSEIVILCVDDEETPLTLRKLVLQKQGFQVITANSAGMAMEMLDSSHIDLVVSDQLMPGGNGTELAQRIKQTRPKMPIILLSGVNEIPQDVHFADSFISKVEGPKALCERISGVLAQRGFALE